MTSNFLSSIASGRVVISQDSNCTVFTFLSWLDLLGVVLAFLISIIKILKSRQNQCIDTGLHILQAYSIWRVIQVILWAFYQNLMKYRFSCKFLKIFLTHSSTEVQRRIEFRFNIVSRDPFRPRTWARFQTGGAQPTLSDVFIYFDILYYFMTPLL